MKQDRHNLIALTFLHVSVFLQETWIANNLYRSSRPLKSVLKTPFYQEMEIDLFLIVPFHMTCKIHIFIILVSFSPDIHVQPLQKIINNKSNFVTISKKILYYCRKF